MDKIIENKVNYARGFFEIEKFPKNILEHLENKDYVYRYKLLIFKEDIGKLSGFIGYGDNDITIICINYKRPIGHQNFTLAHEIGHWFLHKGQAITDTDENMYSYKADRIEKQASAFASELLYPNSLVKSDYIDLSKRDLFNPNKRVELAEKIDELCHKYCLSFDMVLRKILYIVFKGHDFNKIRKEIDKEIGNISTYFEHDFYVPNENLDIYKKYEYPYKLMKDYVNELLIEKKIGEATAESILYRNGIDIS